MATSRPQATKKPALRQPWPWFALALALTALGFWPSFLSGPQAVPAHIFLHGASAILWMALPIVQGLLIVRDNCALHRRLGYLSLLLAGIVVISGLRVIQTMIRTDGGEVELVDFKFVLLDLTGIALFVLFLTGAIRAARDRDVGLHFRLLACTALIPLEAANERTAMLLFPAVVPSFSEALYASLLSMETICLALIVAERRLDRVRWPFPFLLGYYLLMHAIATPVALSPQFQAFSLWYAQLGA